MEQQHATHPHTEREERAPDPLPAETDKGEKLKAEMDALLDDIDQALGENATLAEEFVGSFIQKGGE
jgi:prokaryotic ubiquitin-like protein Pup